MAGRAGQGDRYASSWLARNRARTVLSIVVSGTTRTAMGAGDAFARRVGLRRLKKTQHTYPTG